MALVVFRDVSLDFGRAPLLDRVSMEVDNRERVCLLGRNGTGKTSLLRLILGEQAPDDGQVRIGPGVRVRALAQGVPAVRGTVGEMVAAEAADRDADADDPDWDVDHRVERTLDRLGLEAAARFESLSGGMQRRALLACALAAEPDLLVLDEPTNHLDVESIEWLEGLLLAWRGAVLFTTHDRRLIERIASRILELDRGELTSWPGNYRNYLRRREERLAAEEQANARFDRRLAEEEVWIRQGIKARRTRNEGRVRQLQRMRQERAARRERGGDVRFDTQSAAASGKRVIEATDVTFGFPGSAPVVRGFSALIERGDRVGIIGPNGSGKTTLLRLLLGELAPEEGEIREGARVETAYFDQHRARLDANARVQDAVADGSEHIEWQGQSRHIIGYLQDFLFTPDQARSPVSALSGGERARLLMARLFARPSNLLVLDEPTNDLDIETLELLEERLLEYPGTLLLVSHDRAFLDNVVTSTLVLEGEGRVGEYVGGYADWLRQSSAVEAASEPARNRPAKTARSPAETPGARRLSFTERHELEALPERIDEMERARDALQARLADPEIYQSGGAEVVGLKQSLDEAEAALAAAYERWEALDARD